MINHLTPTPHFKTYADLSSAVVMATDDPSGRKRTCLSIYAGGAGTLVLRPCGNTTNANDVTVTAVAGGVFPLEVERIVSGTATLVTVLWPRVTQL